MDDIEFIQVELTSEIYNLKIKELVKVLLEVDDELELKKDQEKLDQRDAA
jgi:hypothetical protein